MPAWPRRRLPCGLLGMLALVATIEATLAGRLERWEPALTLTWRAASRVASHEARGYDLLCFGDSQLFYALEPRIIEARTGLKTYSLALPGGQAPVSYALLRRALAGGARPRAILVNFNDGLLVSLSREFARLWPEVLDPAEALTVAAVAGDPRLALEPWSARLLPSLRAREGLRAAVLARARGETASGPSLLARIRQEIRDHHGTRPLAHESRDLASAERILFATGSKASRWSCHRTNALFVHRFLALAASERIPVFWILPPVRSAAQAWQERTGLEAAVENFVRAQQAKFPRLVVLDARRVGIDGTLYHDSFHLDAQGGLVFTSALADALAERTPSPVPERWAVLPPVESTIASGSMTPIRR